MKVCEWNSDYSVGINELDSHHKKLFDILEGLFTLMREGAEDKPIIKVLDEFLDYTHYHFDEEEKIMSKMGYPDIEQHKRLHRELIQTLKEFQSSAQNGMAIFVATKVANTGMEWLKNHILTVDHKYYDYMKKQGLQF
jgi:hemerythrin-like metal-binding protein